METEQIKLGRPTDNPRNKRLSLRIAESEMEEIEYCCDKLNLPKIEVVLKGVRLLKQGIKEK